VPCFQAALQENHIRTLLDLGCGEWKNNWIEGVALGQVSYTGVDFVRSLEVPVARPGRTFRLDEDISLEQNTAKYRGFDLVLLKDVLQHMHDDGIRALLRALVCGPGPSCGLLAQLTGCGSRLGKTTSTS
jgi:hypothetical protein